LKTDSKVQQYIATSTSNSENLARLHALKKDIGLAQMKDCYHVFVTREIIRSYDGHRTDTYNRLGCIKCGLKDIHTSELDFTSSSIEEEMPSIYQETARSGVRIDVACSLALAMAIYSGILKKHPTITDQEMVRYFKLALQDIRKTPVTRQHQDKRIRRLGLHPGFSAWNEKDIIHN